MSDLTATLSLVASYTGAEGESIQTPVTTVACPYQAQMHGTMDVPGDATQGTTYLIPFGGIGDDCTLALLVNHTSQPVGLKVNGAAVCMDIAAGGALAVSGTSDTGGNPLTAICLVLTAAQTGTTETLSFHLFGDPTPAP